MLVCSFRTGDVVMDLTLLATLKDKLVTATEFDDVFRYFLDHFGENPKFIALGERSHDPFLVAVIEQIASQIFGKRVPLDNLLLTRLPDHNFTHGGVILNSHLANVLYFDDIRMGLVAVLMGFPTGEMKYARFSGQRPRPVPMNPSAN
jgi:hypothetical protein